MRKLKGILIDPKKRTIKAVEYDDTLEAIYKLLDVTMIEAAYAPTLSGILYEKDTLYVDEEGLLKGPKYFFKLEDESQPLAGRGLITGITPEGEGCDCKTTLEQVDSLIVWVSLDDARGE